MASKPICKSTMKRIKDFLAKDCTVSRLEFPCLSRRTKVGWSYKGQDYRTVSDLLGFEKNKVGIYLDPKRPTAAYATGHDGKAKDRWLMNPKVADNLDSYWSVIVHEATHMVQDYKKMKVSRQEMEMEAHFAQALYLVRTKPSADKADSTSLTKMMPHAEAFNANKRYLKVFNYQLIHQKMMAAMLGGYGKDSDFSIRKRLDGVVV